MANISPVTILPGATYASEPRVTRQSINSAISSSEVFLSGNLTNTYQTIVQRKSPVLNMQSVKDAILKYMRVRRYAEPWLSTGRGNVLKGLSRQISESAATSHDQIMDRVVRLVKKFDKIDAAKVTETADFQKDLSLDSLDRVELVMAFEEEFSLEIPEEKADKLKCCADVAKYIVSETGEKTVKS